MEFIVRPPCLLDVWHIFNMKQAWNKYDLFKIYEEVTTCVSEIYNSIYSIC